MNDLPAEVQEEAREIMGMREDILSAFRRIYSHTLEADKIRIHGDYHLGQALFTGKDIVILDFEGEPSKSYSERRLKRSPLRDVAGMVRSYHYAAYGSLLFNPEITKDDQHCLIAYAEHWYRHMSQVFINSYMEAVADSSFIPKKEEDLHLLLQTYLLEKAIYELNYELNNRPEWVLIPIRGIKAIMKDL